eukprot:GHVT01067259.1.p1 GENE.GHVT01067259.1~~GHVT01067259.1.p1  ORF type:complete len:270 (-),score=78.17 GHVT01067259.1:2649-3347(-)
MTPLALLRPRPIPPLFRPTAFPNGVPPPPWKITGCDGTSHNHCAPSPKTNKEKPDASNEAAAQAADGSAKGKGPAPTQTASAAGDAKPKKRDQALNDQKDLLANNDGAGAANSNLTRTHSKTEADGAAADTAPGNDCGSSLELSEFTKAPFAFLRASSTDEVELARLERRTQRRQASADRRGIAALKAMERLGDFDHDGQPLTDGAGNLEKGNDKQVADISDPRPFFSIVLY